MSRTEAPREPLASSRQGGGILDAGMNLKLVDFNNGAPLQGGDLLKKAMGSAAVPKKKAGKAKPPQEGDEDSGKACDFVNACSVYILQNPYRQCSFLKPCMYR